MVTPALSVDSVNGMRVVTVTVQDRLDAQAGQALIDLARTLVAHAVDRLDIDLRSVCAFSGEGAAALVTCRDLCRELPMGLHYRTGTGAGRAALLAAYEATPSD